MSKQKPTTRSPYERILWLDAQVSEGRYPTLLDYCEQFGINLRTAYRDTYFLRERLGAPLEYDRKRGGYRYTDGSFRLPTIRLSEGELFALYLAEKALHSYAGAPCEDELRAAFRKLCMALPDEVTVDLSGFAETVSFDGGPTRPVEAETYRQALQAVQDRRSLRLRYYAASRDEETARTVDPYHLHNGAGDWYLIAFDHGRADYRDFALSRIRAVTTTEETFTLRDDFDRAAYLANQFGGFRGVDPVEVVVQFDPFQARWMREKRWPGETGREEHADGALTLRLTVTNLDGVRRWVLQYGRHATVLAPPELRAAVAEEAGKMAARYAETREEGSGSRF